MMPKPFADQSGSGLHFHVSLWAQGADGARHALFETAAPEGPSASGAAPRPLPDTLRHFVGGLLHHAAAAVRAGRADRQQLQAPGGRRVAVGHHLGVPAVAHGPDNRTALVRTLHGRLEWRLPTPPPTPTWPAPGWIAAGLDGIDRRLEPGPACTDDLFELPLPALRERGIACLPQSLAEALDALAASTLLREALGACCTPSSCASSAPSGWSMRATSATGSTGATARPSSARRGAAPVRLSTPRRSAAAAWSRPPAPARRRRGSSPSAG